MGYKAKGSCLIVLVAVLGYLWRDDFDPASLANAKVLVTGASTGIGEEIAYHYARAGAELVLTARREHALQEVKKKCLELGAKNVTLVLADMGLPMVPERVVEEAVIALGGLDYLVLNHIGWSPFEMWSGDVNHTRWLMEVNFISYVHLATAALPYLTQSRGSIIVLSSLTAKVPNPYATSYAATKSALEGFFGSWRHELAMKNVPVSITICVLGLIDTQSALEKINGKLSMPAYPAHDAALAVVSAGAGRQLEMYYPWYVRTLSLFRDWFPENRNWVIQNLYKHTSQRQETPA
ncbi:hydroxysteroid 11-beta-dehydrogenase 1-like protein [Rhinophrynus dorsalis]